MLLGEEGLTSEREEESGAALASIQCCMRTIPVQFFSTLLQVYSTVQYVPMCASLAFFSYGKQSSHSFVTWFVLSAGENLVGALCGSSLNQ